MWTSMWKQFFAVAFSAVSFLALPPVDLTRVQAWLVVMWAYAVGGGTGVLGGGAAGKEKEGEETIEGRKAMKAH